MSLRDWFAGQALKNIMRESSTYSMNACVQDVSIGLLGWREIELDAESLSHGADVWAYASYAVADAMLAARQAKEESP
jgi:hypothetical protein